MKTIHGLLNALTVLKPTQNQLALVTAFYEDAESLRFFIETDEATGQPFYTVANDHCGITVKLLLDNRDQVHVMPEDALMLDQDDSQKLREFIQEDSHSLAYFLAIVKALNGFPIDTVTKWITVEAQCTTLHFGVDGKVMIRIELDAAKALLPIKVIDTDLTWPFSVKSNLLDNFPISFFLPKRTRMLEIPKAFMSSYR